MDDSHPFRSMSIGHPFPEIRLFQTLTLKLQDQGHGCGQRARSYSIHTKGKVMQYPINSLPFHFTSIRLTIPEIQPFRNLTLKYQRSKSWVRSKVKITYMYYTLYPTNACPFHFTSIRPTIPIAIIVFDLKKHIQFFFRKFAKITVSYKTSPKSNQVRTMTRAIKLLRFVVIGWVVLTLSRRKANFC